MKHIYLIPESIDSGAYLNKIKQKVDCKVIYQRGLLTDTLYHASYCESKDSLFLDYGLKGRVFRFVIFLISTLFNMPAMVLDKRTKGIINAQLEEHLSITANESYLKKEINKCTKDHIVIMNYDDKYPLDFIVDAKIHLISDTVSDKYVTVAPDELDTYYFNLEPLTVVLLGEACVGKSTLENRLISELGLQPYTILTTREARESDVHTYSVSQEDIDNNDNVVFKFTTVEDTTYAYIRPDRDAVVSFIGYKDAEHLIDDLDNKLVIRLEADREDIEKCYKERGYNEDTIKKRLSIIEKDKEYNIFTIKRDLAFQYIKNYIGGNNV